MPIVAIVRPGCTDFDEQNRIQGVLDLPLNERGRGQLAETVDSLTNWPLESVYASTSDPARSTAEMISEKLGLDLNITDDLQNVNQGLWQGLPVEEVRRMSPRVLKQWQEAPETIRPPEGETVSEALARVLAVLKTPVKREESFAVVTPEPLATLIGCAITGHSPEFDFVAGCQCQEELVEIFSTNGRVPQADPEQPWHTTDATGSRMISNGSSGSTRGG